ncbi:MAG TPA: hypothetical protein VFZ58_04445 [Candidatus Saccharimonadales bacterium]
MLIHYNLNFAARSKPKQGNGRLAWREIYVWRHFKNDELPRITPLGHILTVWIYRFRAVETSDSIRNACIVTEVKFELVAPTPEPRRIKNLVCYDTFGDYNENLKEMLNRLEEEGFHVAIGRPLLPPEAPADSV